MDEHADEAERQIGGALGEAASVRRFDPDDHGPAPTGLLGRYASDLMRGRTLLTIRTVTAEVALVCAIVRRHHTAETGIHQLGHTADELLPAAVRSTAALSGGVARQGHMDPSA